MHRWFFANEEQICRPPPPTTPSVSAIAEPSVSSLNEIPDTEWKFAVKYKGKLCSNEVLAVTGNIQILGKWQVQQCVPMTKIEGSPSLWTLTLMLPRKYDVCYRYLICAINGDNGRKLVRFWETHKKGRLIRTEDVQELECPSYETFGVLKGITDYNAQRGWLSSSDIRILQFRFDKAPFVLKMEKDKLAEVSIHVKLSLLRVRSKEEGKDEQNSNMSCNISKETGMENCDFQQNLPKMLAFCEVANVGREDGSTLRYQSKYGTRCGPNDILLFHMTLDDMTNTAYLIDLYTYPSKPAEDIPPYHFGYQHILPQQLNGSEGTLNLPIMCATRHRPIGNMTVEYLLIKPLNSVDFNLEKPFEWQWKKKPSLDIGHRGCGKSFWHQKDVLRENTLKSFGKAFDHGADFVELDVHLTQDKVPIVYHDFQLYVSRQEDLSSVEFDIFKLNLEADDINGLRRYAKPLKSGLIAISLNKFKLEHLEDVKIYNGTSKDIPSSSSFISCPKDNTLNLPFPSLEKVLKKLPIKLGFLLDIKWPQQLQNGKHYEENFQPDMDKNEYVDNILNTVLRKSGNRRIIFSSFDADICSMIRFKQNLYPTMFIIKNSETDLKYLDPRGELLPTASYFARAIELYGVVAESDDILRASGEISNFHKRNIHLFAWGDVARSEQCRRSLKAADVDGIIFDRINHVTNVEDLKQNIFLIELKENTRKMSLGK
uniref:GP-PDE domain-containing protein n=1 Tax=Musca domestica TaxID=7370 RepID=A0A1I8MPM3_MUSDO